MSNSLHRRYFVSKFTDATPRDAERQLYRVQDHSQPHHHHTTEAMNAPQTHQPNQPIQQHEGNDSRQMQQTPNTN
uniref:Uncharacterized protein n=1 Tax=Steinernema glaseri TaxID=37863 RepID=A0A1I7ZS33_9BILA